MILRQTVTELCTFVQVATVCRTSLQYLIAFCSQLEAASDVISGRFVRLALPDSSVKFMTLNCSPEIQPEAVGDGISAVFFLTSVNADRKLLMTLYPVWL